MERSSGGTIYSRKLTREYHRPLKNAIKKSAEAAIIAKDNQFRRQYLKLTIEKAILSHKAKLTVSRSRLAHKLNEIYYSTKSYYRVINIADTFEAITAERVFKKASSIGNALGIMISNNKKA